MRFSKLYQYMFEQTLYSPMFKAFFILIMLLMLGLFLVPAAPSAKLVQSLCLIFVPVYFIIATSGSIIEKTERFAVELLLSKPFTRRDIVLADFLGVISSVTIAVLTLSVILFVVFGVRQNIWDAGFLGLCCCLVSVSIFLYCFIVLSGILTRNAGLVMVIWIGYIYFGAVIVEAKSVQGGTGISNLFFQTAHFFLPQLFALQRSFSNLFLHSSFDGLPLLESAGSSAAVLFLAIVYFSKKEIE